MTNKMQLCRIIYYSLAALHVLSDIFAHRQEYLNCITASGITHVCNTVYRIFDVRKSVNHHTIQINQPTRCNSFTSLLLVVYVWLNVFRAPLRPSSGAYNCTRSLWFYRCSVTIGSLLVAVETTTNNAQTATLQL